MLLVTKGFIVDVHKTSISNIEIYFEGGCISDLPQNLLYVRRGFSFPRENGLVYVYYNPMEERHIVKTTKLDDNKEAYLGALTITDDSISMILPSGFHMTPIEFITSEKGLTQNENLIVDHRGYISPSKTPRVIMEIYVAGYGYRDISSVVIMGNDINLNAVELAGAEVRVVYES